MMTNAFPEKNRPYKFATNPTENALQYEFLIRLNAREGGLNQLITHPIAELISLRF